VVDEQGPAGDAPVFEAMGFVEVGLAAALEGVGPLAAEKGA